MIGLTRREADCLAAIKRLTQEGVPPSYEGLAEALGVASRSAVHQLVHKLKARGAITLEPNAPRSIRVLDDIEGLERHTTEHLIMVMQRCSDIILERTQ